MEATIPPPTATAEDHSSLSQVSHIFATSANTDIDDLPSEFGDDDALLSYASRDEDVLLSYISHEPQGKSSPSFSLMESFKTSELRRSEHPENSLKPFNEDPCIQPTSSSDNETIFLDFDSLGLIRREEEVASLKDCFDCSVESSSKELVLISGESGSGKTSLALTLENERTNRKKGVFVQGKFDLNTSDGPYSGIAKAIGQICSWIIKDNTSEDDVACISSAISSALGEEMKVLLHLIPELKKIVVVTTTMTKEYTDMDDIQEVLNGIERMRYAFRVLIRILSDHLSLPMVIVLDDLQWADIASLQVLDYVISDVQHTNPMVVVGCYRSNEVDENSLLYNKILALRDKAPEFSFNLTEIKIENFQEEDVSMIIEKMLPSQNEEKILQLASLCVRRTLGNPFFTFEFLKMLQAEQLLTHDAISGKWDWETSRIESVTMSTANVVFLLQDRMRKLEDNVQRFMQCAACLGSTFTLPMLSLVWSKFNMTGITGATSSSVDALISLVEEEKFVEAIENHRYRWIHDKVQEAALSLPGTVDCEFQFHVGSSLLYYLEKQHLEDVLFNVADLINSGTKNKRWEFAELNLRAAEKARSISAFHTATKFAAHGIALLPNEKWNTNRSLTLRLYTIGYEMELAVGRADAAEVYGREVMNQESCTTMEKFPLQIAQLGKLCYVDMKFGSAIDASIALMNELGYGLVWNKATVTFQALVTLHRTVQIAKKAPAPTAVLESIGKMTDKRHLALMQLLEITVYAAYHSVKPFVNVIATCKLVELTLKHGVCDHSPPAFTGFGIILIAVKQDYASAARFAEMGLALLRGVGPSREALTIFTGYALVLPWKIPIESIQPMMDKAYVSGAQVGDSTHICWALLSRVWVPFVLGRPLVPVLKQCPLLATQIQELEQTEQLVLLKILWQAMSDIVSPSSNHNYMEGEGFRLSEFRSTNPIHLGMLHFANGEVWLHWEPKLASERAISGRSKFLTLCPGVLLGQIETFHRGVALYAMARLGKSRKYTYRANEVRKTLQKWVKAGNPNVVLYLVFLNAEHASLKKQTDKAANLYKKAIALATEKSDLRHQGLFHERFAAFLLLELKDKAKHAHHLQESMECFEKWGSVQKASELKKAYIIAQG